MRERDVCEAMESYDAIDFLSYYESEIPTELDEMYEEIKHLRVNDCGGDEYPVNDTVFKIIDDISSTIIRCRHELNITEVITCYKFNIFDTPHRNKALRSLLIEMIDNKIELLSLIINPEWRYK